MLAGLRGTAWQPAEVARRGKSQRPATVAHIENPGKRTVFAGLQIFQDKLKVTIGWRQGTSFRYRRAQ
jgi:hypothetical protein